MTPTGQAAVLVAITLVCGAFVAGCGNGVRTEGDAPRATPSSSAPAPAPTDLSDLRKLVDGAESAAAAADSDAAADR
ncbi:hypothetical protein ACWDBF_02470 [Streptomyces angustmyceticus]|uniref:hypothetical protein n=1 Tax=Streptomyces angustmyceticus TaxID=285578 RepID=UPI0021AEBA1A|nr:hypothetical protein [Streptomyces angustmyceticus]